MDVETWRLHCIEKPLVVNDNGNTEAGHVLLNVGMQYAALGDIQGTPEVLLCDWVADNRTDAGGAVTNWTQLRESAENASKLRLMG